MGDRHEVKQVPMGGLSQRDSNPKRLGSSSYTKLWDLQEGGFYSELKETPRTGYFPLNLRASSELVEGAMYHGVDVSMWGRGKGRLCVQNSASRLV